MRPHLALLVAAVLLLAGVVLLAGAQTSPAGCGSFAYAPVQGRSASTAFVLAGRQLPGAVLVALGLLVLAADLGRRVGRRAG